MRDYDVRNRLSSELRKWHRAKDTLFIDEFDLGGLVRVDVAAVNGALWGYEIKSDRDTLKRLPRQAEIYSRVLDYAALVVADKHCKSASKLVPEWWQILTVIPTPTNDLEIRVARKGTCNPCVDPNQLVQLLWREEALQELSMRGLEKGIRSKPRKVLWETLVNSLTIQDIQAIVRSRLRARQDWRARPKQA